ncbi:hypothetical protein [Paenibacillus sp. HJGM_3]|uniref:hypothetical protein n=1 Tax=Paenibacillus sp. HJGM_3 TaxID=3379816 RepID=UPI00385D35E5
MRQEEFDRLFDEAFETAARQLETTPDSTPSWERVRAVMERQRKRARMRKRLQLAGVIAASLLLGSFLFGQPLVSRAFPPVVQQLQSVGDRMVGFFFGADQRNRSAKTEPPPNSAQAPSSGSIGELKRETVSLEEAKTRVVFSFPALPVGEPYRLKEVVLYYGSNQTKANQARLRYEADTGKGRFLNIYITELNTSTVLSSGANDGGEIETVEMAGKTQGYLVRIGESRYSLEFLLQASHVTLTGDLGKAEIIELANRIKRDTDG